MSRRNVYSLGMYSSQLHACVDSEVSSTVEVWICTFIQGKCGGFGVCTTYSPPDCVHCAYLADNTVRVYTVTVSMRRPRVLPRHAPSLCSPGKHHRCVPEGKHHCCVVCKIHTVHAVWRSVHIAKSMTPLATTHQAAGCAKHARPRKWEGAHIVLFRAKVSEFGIKSTEQKCAEKLYRV